MMQTIAPQPVPSPDSSSAPESLQSSVAHLLAKATSLPCSAAYSAFSNLVRSTFRFQVALDVLLPVLCGKTTPPLRILASYILYSLYASYPLAMNPFGSVFLDVFIRERDRARVDSGGMDEAEQLVWALWKILKGEGIDLGPYSAIAIAASPLPPKLRAAQLTLGNDHKINGVANGNEYDDQMSTSGTELHEDLRENLNSSKSTLDGREELAISQTLVALLSEAYSRVLTMTEQRSLATILQDNKATPFISPDNLLSLISLNPVLGYLAVVSLMTSSSSSEKQPQYNYVYLETLRILPPYLPSIDVLGRLLRDSSSMIDFKTRNSITIADLIRREVLGPFINNSIRWIENAEREESEGLINDDRVSKTIQILCRFYSSMIKLNIIDPASEAESAEMKHFTLSHSRFEEANTLYRSLVKGNS